MKIGVLRVLFQIHGVHSLKEKRSIVRSLKDRLFSRFNVSVAEVGSNDVWQTGEIGIVTVSNDHQFVESVLNKVEDCLESYHPIRVVDVDREILY